MIVQDSEEKSSVKSAPRDEETRSQAAEQSPPPYSPPLQGSSKDPTPSPLFNLSPDLAPANYIHVKERNNNVKRKVLLDLDIPRPPASALPPEVQGEDIPHLLLDSQNGTVSGEIWVVCATKRSDDPATAGRAHKPAARERVRLHLHARNGTVNARVHIHPSTVEPRPFLDIEARSLNGSVGITIPRSFRGQLTLHSDNGRAILSSALKPRAATLSTVNGTHTYFVGERPSRGTWNTGTNEEGEEVDAVVGWTKNGSVRVSYDDEAVACPKGPGVLSSLFRAIGF
ncbi:hypothetical protein F5148DRAFT_1284258 [Russula earlei]|uniref:Uncharacterized protein n=1 Tax=Russula earlei TaxID=71964 RepID=A0ACC0U9R4_9AGAM|nr:hypothetical protein F5148DRAFT_1284258 [Russula earlei]